MIEILLQAERALTVGLVDQAERLYTLAADADPRNSIAVVGLARVALERGDEPEAWREATRALTIDPENIAAQRLAGRLEEVYAYRGESLPEIAGASASDAVGTGGAPGASAGAIPAAAVSKPASKPAAPAASKPGAPAASKPAASRKPAAAGAPPATGASPKPPPAERGVVDRLLRRNRP